MEEKLFTECQYSFIPGGLSVTQLLTHVICKNFGCNPLFDIKGTFADISKAFDKVWHEGLICKLKSYGIGGNPLKLLENYLKTAKKELL